MLAKREIEHQLSSPITSYDFKEDLTKKAVLAFNRRKSYPERLKSTKQELRDLRFQLNEQKAMILQQKDMILQQKDMILQQKDMILQQKDMILELKARAQAEDDIILDGETRSRLAQALNDWYIQTPNIQTECDLLDDQGCGYLPYVLSAWALWYSCDPATRFQITDEESRRHHRKASELCHKGLADVVDTIWYALPALDRSLMIAMWLGRRSGLRTPVVHPTPAAWEGRNVIASDPQLSDTEKARAQYLIPRAVNRRNERLFTGV